MTWWQWAILIYAPTFAVTLFFVIAMVRMTALGDE